jgi:hypothetical protein
VGSNISQSHFGGKYENGQKMKEENVTEKKEGGKEWKIEV